MSTSFVKYVFSSIYIHFIYFKTVKRVKQSNINIRKKLSKWRENYLLVMNMSNSFVVVICHSSTSYGHILEKYRNRNLSKLYLYYMENDILENKEISNSTVTISSDLYKIIEKIICLNIQQTSFAEITNLIDELKNKFEII